MKTILLLIIFCLTAWSGYSQSDSVRLSNQTANKIYADLRDCDLARMQLSYYQLSDSLMNMTIVAQDQKIEILLDESLKQKKWFRRPLFWALGGLVGGALLTK